MHEETLKKIENARRTKSYNDMILLGAPLKEQLLGDDSKESWAVRARVDYEWSMAYYQRTLDPHEISTEKILKESMRLAQSSMDAAKRADDRVGVLFAQMNIGGLLLPALGRLQEGFDLSQSVLAKAFAIVSEQGSSAERKRANQVAMNCCMHLIKNGIDLGFAKNAIRMWSVKLVTNPMFRDHRTRDPNFAEDLLKRAHDYSMGPLGA